MKVLFDQGTPVPLRRYLHPHPVDTAAEMGWSALANGELLAAAERAGYDLLITTDQNLRWQQDLERRPLGVLVLKTTSWPRIQPQVQRVVAAVNQMTTGGYTEIAF